MDFHKLKGAPVLQEDAEKKLLPEEKLFFYIIWRAFEDIDFYIKKFKSYKIRLISNNSNWHYSFKPLATAIKYIFFENYKYPDYCITTHLSYLYDENQSIYILREMRRICLEKIKKEKEVYNWYLEEVSRNKKNLIKIN